VFGVTPVFARRPFPIDVGDLPTAYIFYSEPKPMEDDSVHKYLFAEEALPDSTVVMDCYPKKAVTYM
jgi:hypothetical protein